MDCPRFVFTDGRCVDSGCANCPARQYTPPPSKVARSRWPERLALVGIILSAAIGIWAGGKALERVDRAYQLEARI